MDRRASSFIALAAIATFALVAWYFSGKPPEPAAVASAPALASAAIATPAASSIPVSISATDQVPQWIADSNSGDAAKRAAAITALAGAPRSEALPVLARILMNGEPQVDRPLALRSLRDLALNQGDADGRIRDAVRQAIYHGDDFTATADVQEVLDIIEESELK